jgi:hypothetical protein
VKCPTQCALCALAHPRCCSHRHHRVTVFSNNADQLHNSQQQHTDQEDKTRSTVRHSELRGVAGPKVCSASRHISQRNTARTGALTALPAGSCTNSSRHPVPEAAGSLSSVRLIELTVTVHLCEGQTNRGLTR